MDFEEERERWLGMMEGRNREIDALNRDIEGYPYSCIKNMTRSCYKQ